jgi:hypothetical protein
MVSFELHSQTPSAAGSSSVVHNSIVYNLVHGLHDFSDPSDYVIRAYANGAFSVGHSVPAVLFNDSTVMTPIPQKTTFMVGDISISPNGQYFLISVYPTDPTLNNYTTARDVTITLVEAGSIMSYVHLSYPVAAINSTLTPNGERLGLRSSFSEDSKIVTVGYTFASSNNIRFSTRVMSYRVPHLSAFSSYESYFGFITHLTSFDEDGAPYAACTLNVTDGHNAINTYPNFIGSNLVLTHIPRVVKKLVVGSVREAFVMEQFSTSAVMGLGKYRKNTHLAFSDDASSFSFFEINGGSIRGEEDIRTEGTLVAIQPIGNFVLLVTVSGNEIKLSLVTIDFKQRKVDIVESVTVNGTIGANPDALTVHQNRITLTTNTHTFVYNIV